MTRQHGSKRFGLARKLVAELEALIADGLAFRERDTQRRLAAQRRKIVVAPGNRVDADLDVEWFGHCLVAIKSLFVVPTQVGTQWL